MNPFSIRAAWGPRSETPAQVAKRLDDLLSLLRPVAPALRRWYQVISEDDLPELDAGAEWLVNAVAASVCTGDLGEPAPALGYLPITLNRRPTDQPRADDVYVHMACGSKHGNWAALRPARFQDLDPALLTFPIFRQTVLAFSKAFEPEFCEAGPFSLWQDMKMSHYARDPVITPCWMIHLSPPLARRITLPSDVVSERFADGSLFLSVTDQRFDPDDSSHVAAAHRLFAVVDTLQEKLPPEKRRG